MITFLSNNIKYFFDFLKMPTEKQDSEYSLGNILKSLITFTLIDIPVMLLLLLIIQLIEYTGIINSDSNQLMENFQDVSLTLIFVIGVVVIPFVEELVFRLYLRFNTNYIVKFILAISFLFGKQFGLNFKEKVFKFWHTKYQYIFYASALIFGLVHLSNYYFSWWIVLIFPILIAPQFFVGLMIGYLRVKYNLLTGFFLHAIHNLIFLIFPLLFFSNTTEKININNTNYQLKIDELILGNDHALFNLSSDSISFNACTVNRITSFLMGIDESLLLSNNEIKSNIKLNLLYKSNASKPTIDNNIILEKLSGIYNFKIDSNFKNVEILELIVADSTKLIKHLNFETSLSAKAKEFDDKLTITNANLFILAEQLTRHLNIRVVYKNENYLAKYNFYIDTENKNRIKDLIESEYGIILAKKYERVLDYKIIFN